LTPKNEKNHQLKTENKKGQTAFFLGKFAGLKNKNTKPLCYMPHAKNRFLKSSFKACVEWCNLLIMRLKLLKEWLRRVRLAGSLGMNTAGAVGVLVPFLNVLFFYAEKPFQRHQQPNTHKTAVLKHYINGNSHQTCQNDRKNKP
jgi:hypothetical protein